MSDHNTLPPKREHPSRPPSATVEAMRVFNQRLEMAENAGLAAVSKLAQIVAIVSETRSEVSQNHRHVMEAIDKIGSQVSQLYEAVVVQEGRIGRLEKDRHNGNGHVDAE